MAATVPVQTLRDFDDWAKEKPPTNRVRAYRIPARVLFRFLYAQGGIPDVVEVPDCRLPEGCKLLGLSYSPLGCYWEVLVAHDSFDEVPEGQDPPSFPALVEYRTCEVVKPEPTADRPVHVYR